MAVTLGPPEEEDGDLVASINTTPLVDVMLVLLIIFLITVPVVTHTIKVALPHEINQPNQTKPQNINIAVDKSGSVYWGEAQLPDNGTLLERLKRRANDVPQPEVQIRADADARYEYVGRVVVDCQRAGIAKVTFIVQPGHGASAGAS